MKFHHLGIAVANLDGAARAYTSIFGYKLVSGPFDDPVQKVSVCFLRINNSASPILELVAPLCDDSPVKSILSRGGGAYHVCFETPHLDDCLADVISQGCMLVRDPVPAFAFGGRRIAWILTPVRQLIELLEEEPA